jgi:hypothetical protein
VTAPRLRLDAEIAAALEAQASYVAFRDRWPLVRYLPATMRRRLWAAAREAARRARTRRLAHERARALPDTATLAAMERRDALRPHV